MIRPEERVEDLAGRQRELEGNMATLVQYASARFASISRAMKRLTEIVMKQNRVTEGTQRTGEFLLEMQ